MTSIVNIDLLSVGITVAASIILGVVIFINNRRSATNILFLCFIIANTGWSIANYLNYHSTNQFFVLWIIRFVLFFATLQAFSFFMLMYVFPGGKLKMPPILKWSLILCTGFVAILTLSPYVFPKIITTPGQVAQPIPAFGIAIFGTFGVSLVIGGIILLIKKIKNAPTRIEKAQFEYLLWGVVIMFGFIIAFNFISPVFFQITKLIPLASLFTFPFIIFTVYAILKHHLLNIKVIATEVLAFPLSVISLGDVLFSTDINIIIFRAVQFTMVLIFSIFLIQSVQKEVKQREQLQILDEKLETANVQLEELNRFKSQLLSLASHQIRSPLAAIKGFGSLLIQGAYGPISDSIKATIEKMNRSTEGLLDLINTLLDMRKVEEGKMEYQFVRADLNAIIANVMETLRPLADAKKLEFSFSLPEKTVLVNADPEKFKQVIQNLVDNAIKYTATGFVHVELKISPVDMAGSPPPTSIQGIPLPPNAGHGGHAIISVSDSGYGIPAPLLPHIFEEFIRDERVKKQVLGTGLGLYIARKIAEAHNGTIQAESTGEGKGSTFHVTIPLA